MVNPMTDSIAVLGATGFIGHAALDAVIADGSAPTIHAMSRSMPDSTRGTVIQHTGDIRDIDSVRATVRGTRAAIHAASYVGYDPELCHEINSVGTANVVAACKAEGVQRIVYVSTASVYGSGPHRGEKEHELSVSPQSTLSRSRADAEKSVLDAGGVAVRPDMVFGEGDRWFVPALAKFVTALGGVVDDGSARMSVVNVRDLATAVVELALSTRSVTGPYHVAYSEPSTVACLLAALRPATGWPFRLPTHTLKAALPLALANGFTERQFELLTTDHWYSTAAIDRALGTAASPAFSMSERDLDWYRRHLAPRMRTIAAL
jgi:nucleoside-diphosphate-sugar epimerase